MCRMRITHGTPDFGVDVAKEDLQVFVTQSTDQASGEALFIQSPREKMPPGEFRFPLPKKSVFAFKSCRFS